MLYRAQSQFPFLNASQPLSYVSRARGKCSRFSDAILVARSLPRSIIRFNFFFICLWIFRCHFAFPNVSFQDSWLSIQRWRRNLTYIRVCCRGNVTPSTCVHNANCADSLHVLFANLATLTFSWMSMVKATPFLLTINELFIDHVWHLSAWTSLRVCRWLRFQLNISIKNHKHNNTRQHINIDDITPWSDIKPKHIKELKHAKGPFNNTTEPISKVNWTVIFMKHYCEHGSGAGQLCPRWK